MRIETDALGKALHESRIKAGLSQKEVAQALGCTAGYIHHLEHNLSVPSVDKMQKFIDVTNADPKEIQNKVLRAVRREMAQMGIV